jgi:glucosamine--fructose-6-phosphate aminotransferase (isomerizing)
MCGIVGYIGKNTAVPILLDGLRRLEYRGYDSAGVAVLDGGGIEVRKRIGRIANLAELIKESPPPGNVGISHTRWATHGGVTDANAHPHFDKSGRLTLVHNGVIENYAVLREQLISEGHTFLSQTDTEVLAHLVGKHYDAAALGDKEAAHTKARLVNAIRAALKQVVGTYGIVVMHQDLPETLVGARRGSPLVLGLGKGENFFASDVSAIVAHTREAIYLKDYDIAALTKDEFEITSLLGGTSGYEVSKVEFSEEDVSKGKYPHYMLKEIFEQPDTIQDAMRGRLSTEEATAKLGGLDMSNAQLRAVDRIILAGCGTASHAAMVGEYVIESLAHCPDGDRVCERVPLPEHAAAKGFAGLSASARAARPRTRSPRCARVQRKGHRTLGHLQQRASTIARESDGGVYMHAGQEIGVAAHESFPRR